MPQRQKRLNYFMLAIAFFGSVSVAIRLIYKFGFTMFGVSRHVSIFLELSLLFFAVFTMLICFILFTKRS